MKLYSLFRVVGSGAGLLLASGVVLSAAGQSGSTAAFDYWVQDDGVVITEGHTSFSGPLSIPETIEGRPVVKIDDYAFFDHDGITSLELPSSLSVIDYRAFFRCDGFTNIYIPEGVEMIGNEAFWQCNLLAEITLPASLTAIGEYAFGNGGEMVSFSVDPANPAYADVDGVLFSKDGKALIDYPKKWKGSRVYAIPEGTVSVNDRAFNGVFLLRNITLPESLEFIGDSGFAYCGNWTNAVLPSGLQSIGPLAFVNCKKLPEITIPVATVYVGVGAFEGCLKMESIYVDPGNPSYSSQDGILYNDDLTRLICCPSGWSGIARLPNGVRHIGYHAFFKCTKVSQIILPDSVETIGDEAFRNVFNPDQALTYSTLSNVVFSAGVTVLGKQMFLGCNNLQSITVDEANRHFMDIDGVLFNSDGTVLLAYPPGRAGHYSVPEGVEKIHEYAFSDCDQLTSLAIPDSVTYFSREAFKDCAKLATISLPGHLENIGRDVFGTCASLTDFMVSSPGEYLSSIDGVLFSADGKTLVQYPSGRSGKYAVPEGTEEVEGRAFYKCESLSGVSLPTTLHTVGADAFAATDSLRSSVFYGHAPVLAGSAFSAADDLFSIYYLDSAAGYSSPEWNGYPADLLQRPVLRWETGGFLAWFGQSGLDYQVESTTNLLSDSWIATNELVVGSAATNYVAPGLTADCGMYRVQIDLP